jgi:hypothetical protein
MTAFKRILLSLLALCFSMPALANPAPQWKLVQRVGEVWITSDQFQPVSLSINGAVPEKSVIVTGQKGRAVLSRGTEQIILQPNSRLVIPETKGNTTRLEQSRGSALFRVDRKKLPHFRVDTPYLAAVVKGTIFHVVVSDKVAVVRVSEGAVSVATAKGEAETLVKPGMVAEVRATNTVVIDLTDEAGKKRRIIDRQTSPTPATNERFDWGPGGSAGGDSGSDDGNGLAGPDKEASFQNIQLRDTFAAPKSRQMVLLRSSTPDTSLAEFAVDAATRKQMKLREDRRVARFSNLEHIVDTQAVADAATKGLEKVQIASGKNFLKTNNVKVESKLTSSAIQNLILGGVGVLVVYQLLKTLFRRKRA